MLSIVFLIPCLLWSDAIVHDTLIVTPMPNICRSHLFVSKILTLTRTKLFYVMMLTERFPSKTDANEMTYLHGAKIIRGYTAESL